jgi:protein involved in polysaccharide export with SLBB domain
MQVGRFNKIFDFKYVLLFIAFGTGVVYAQSQFGQSLGVNAAQSACGPTDPNCQSGSDQIPDPGNYQNQNRINQGQQIPNTQGVILPGQPGVPQSPNSLNTNRLSQQDSLKNRESRLLLDSPTEFQQMVANTTGKMLPIYGAKLFRNPPSTFAPLDMVPVTPDYVIGPGDELLIQVWGQVTLNGHYFVDRSGSIYVPQVGTMRVAGLPFGQVQTYLKSQMGKVFRNFDLNVNMGQLRSIQVFVVGQAQLPGNYTISSLSTLVNALFATGGPSPQGSLRHIQLKRGGQVVVDFDLYDLLQRGDKSHDVPLLPGDVIYIPPVGPQVAVAGSVNKPAIYELKSASDSTVGEAISLAAGLTNVAADQKARLERVDEGRMRSIIEVPLDAAGRTKALRDGDILELGAVVNRYKDAITLRGNVANPGRYTWKQGMRVHDLFPDKDALITRDYWLKRSQLGQPTLTFVPTCTPNTPYGIPNLRYGLPAGDGGDDSIWRLSSIKDQNLIGQPFGIQDGRLINSANGGNTANRNNSDDDGPQTDGGPNCQLQYESDVQSFANANRNNSGDQYQYSNSASRNSAGNSSNSPALQRYDNKGTSSERTSAANASISGSTGQFLPRNDVKLSEPDIDWSYAVIERQSKEDLKTSLLSFNLGRVVMQGDTSQNLELQPGDVVTIFSTADIHVPQSQQTKFVRLEGEFNSAGVYSAKPGETLRQLVQRAGGLTPDAYLFGSEFTRESTRHVQQQRLTEYVDQIELQASTNAANGQGRSISAQDTAAATAEQVQDENIVNRLRQARPTGRIVLNLPPDTHDVSQLPDIPLENGDHFIVPRIPLTVSVDGAVYNQNSFLYNQERRVGGYIRLAGGANRDSDKSRAYVIRADGSVISKQYSSSLHGNSFDSLRIYPGDTVVVPLNLNKGQGLRTLVDVAQIVGQFGIAIAAADLVF